MHNIRLERYPSVYGDMGAATVCGACNIRGKNRMKGVDITADKDAVDRPVWGSCDTSSDACRRADGQRRLGRIKGQFCPFCRGKIPHDFIFCPNCGRNV